MKSFPMIIISILFIVVACGRRGTLEKPENEKGPYPRQYPAPGGETQPNARHFNA